MPPHKLVARFGHSPHPLEDFSFKIADTTVTMRYFKIDRSWHVLTGGDKVQYWEEAYFRVTLNEPLSDPQLMFHPDKKRASEYWSVLKERERDLANRIETWERDRRFSLDHVAIKRKALAKIEADEKAALDSFRGGADALSNKRKQELERNIRDHEEVLMRPRPKINDSSGVGFEKRLRMCGGPTVRLSKIVEIYEAKREWWMSGFGVTPSKKWKHPMREGRDQNNKAAPQNGIVLVFEYKT